MEFIIFTIKWKLENRKTRKGISDVHQRRCMWWWQWSILENNNICNNKATGTRRQRREHRSVSSVLKRIKRRGLMDKRTPPQKISLNEYSVIYMCHIDCIKKVEPFLLPPHAKITGNDRLNNFHQSISAQWSEELAKEHTATNIGFSDFYFHQRPVQVRLTTIETVSMSQHERRLLKYFLCPFWILQCVPWMFPCTHDAFLHFVGITLSTTTAIHNVVRDQG